MTLPHRCSSAAPDIEFSAAQFRISGTDRSVGPFKLAARWPDRQIRVDCSYSADAQTSPAGCQVCEVEIDPETEAVRLARLVYALPRAGDLPSFISVFDQNSPSRSNSLGAKGVGEPGTCGAAPAVVHAIIDALRSFGLQHIGMPVTREKVWRLIEEKPATS
jgi:carbon-monoxide dehydrogenase large subunit